MKAFMNDDQALLEPSDEKELPAGDDPQLEAGDDPAAQALKSVDNFDSDDDEEGSDNLANTIMSLQNIIERNADALDEVKDQIKLNREQLKSVFENDTELAAAEEEAKKFSTQVKERKGQLQGDPTVTRIKVEIGELKEKQTEIEEALSNHLVNFYSLTNSRSFDTSDGDQREFVIRAKVKGRRKSSS